MHTARKCTHTLVLGLLLLAPQFARADYISESVSLSLFGQGGTNGSVTVEAYDGTGSAGGGLTPGEVRLTFHADPATFGQPPGGGGINYSFSGFQAIGFNTDLTLNANQISGPNNWVSLPNLALAGAGPFNWAVGTGASLQNDVSILITGLGTSATVGHFTLPSQPSSDPAISSAVFAGSWALLNFGSAWTGATSYLLTAGGGGASGQGGAPGPNDAPEPSTLALAGLGLAGLFARRSLRKRPALA